MKKKIMNHNKTTQVSKRSFTSVQMVHTHTEQQLLCREEDALLVKLLSVALLNGSMNLMKV